MKNTIILMLLGALGGIAAASYVVPRALSWYTEPGGLPDGATIQALVQIPEVIRYSTGRLIRGQLIGGVVGSLVGLALGIMWARRGRRAKTAASAVLLVLASLPALARAQERAIVRDVAGGAAVSRLYHPESLCRTRHRAAVLGAGSGKGATHGPERCLPTPEPVV
jgi:hypothetical protein